MGPVGALVVAVLLVGGWIGGQAYSNRADDRWWDRYDRVVHDNAGRLGTSEPQEPWPEKSFAVEHPNVLSALAAVVVGVVGTIVVLLFSINSSLQRKEPSPQR